MPELSRFEGMVIKMLFNDTVQHNKPHVHVTYGEYKASVGMLYMKKKHMPLGIKPLEENILIKLNHYSRGWVDVCIKWNCIC